MKGYTHVISVVGNPVLRLQPAMIEAAVQAGVTHFYPSEWNSDISQKEIYSMRYFRDKQVTRSHLAATAKRHPAFKYTLFITGIFTEWSVLEFYGFDHEKLKVSVYGEPNAIVGVTSIPEYVVLPVLLFPDSFVQIHTNKLSIARYTVASLLIPFKPTTASGSERTIRVEGERTIFQSLVDSLGAAKSVTYETVYLPVADAAAKQEVARLDGNEENEMMWSIRPLIASGFGTAGSTLDNELFDFAPETIQATFQRIYST